MDITIGGQVDPRFIPVQERFRKLWDDIEVGAALCIYLDGKPVVDIWGGFKDPEMNDPWQADTLVNVYSTTKGLATLAFAQLVDEGLVAYEDPAARYWPEFAQAGKANITIAQLLSHQGGLCGVEEKLTVADLYDWEKMTGLLARQKPLWEPGTAAGYHAVTWGYLPGELIRRITGMTLGQWFAEKVAIPLDADFYIGLDDADFDRCATLIGPNRARKQQETTPATDEAPPKMSPLFPLSLLNPSISPFRDACSPEWRRAEIAASNGHASARGVARIYSAMAEGGTLDGRTIISGKTLEAARKVEVDQQIDLVTNTVMRRSRGFILAHDGNYGAATEGFGHAGAGGSLGFADPERNVGFGYVMNQMQADTTKLPRSRQLIDAFYECLEAE